MPDTRKPKGEKPPPRPGNSAPLNTPQEEKAPRRPATSAPLDTPQGKKLPSRPSVATPQTPFPWRSHVESTFVKGRLGAIDNYYGGRALVWGIYEMISQYDLWNLAFPANAMKMNKLWNKLVKGYGGSFEWCKRLASPRELSEPLVTYVLRPLQAMFDRSDLTINFNHTSWFSGENTYPTYTPMWQRKPTDAHLNRNPDPKNPAHVRAKADRWALYGQFGKDATRAANPNLNLAHVKYSAGQPNPNQPPQPSSSPAPAPSPSWSYSPTKPPPQHCQVFAALNYADRKYGGCYDYGRSYIVLNKRFKKNAIFFAMDTFYPLAALKGMELVARQKAERNKLYQVSANSFAGSILWAIKMQASEAGGRLDSTSKTLVTELLKAARNTSTERGNPLGEPTKEPTLLIEAHLFQILGMNSSHIDFMWTSRRDKCDGQWVGWSDKMLDNMHKWQQFSGVKQAWIPGSEASP